MAGRRLTWAKRALEERKKILDYWRYRNKSKDYSVKLFILFNDQISLLIAQPEIGIIFNRSKNIRYVLNKNYRIYYTYSDSEISVLSIWDLRRNPDNHKL